MDLNKGLANVGGEGRGGRVPPHLDFCQRQHALTNVVILRYVATDLAYGEASID